MPIINDIKESRFAQGTKRVVHEWAQWKGEVAGANQQIILDARGLPALYITLRPIDGIEFDWKVEEAPFPPIEDLDESEFFELAANTLQTSTVVVRKDKMAGLIRITIDTGLDENKVAVKAIIH